MPFPSKILRKTPPPPLLQPRITPQQSKNPLFFIRLGILSVLLLGVHNRHVLAQSVPPGEDVGSQAKRLQEQNKLLQKTFDIKKPVAKPVETPPEEGLATPDQKVPFLLTGIDFPGATVFTPQELLTVYSPYLNQKVTFEDINKIMDLVKTKYRKMGYYTTTAYLPPQEIKEGIVEIRVVEGKMGQLNVEGNRRYRLRTLTDRVHVKRDELLNMNVLTQDVLRINKNGDIQAKAVIAKGSQPQTVDLTLKVQEKRPWHVGILSNNQGSRALGPYSGGYYVRTADLSGIGDTLMLSNTFGGRSLGSSLNYRTPIDSHGTTLGLSYSRYTMKLGREFKPFDITGASNSGTIELSKELYLKENLSANAITGLDIKSTKRKVLGSTSYNDQLRIPFIGIDIDHTDPRGSTSFSPRMDFGTGNFLGASSRNHPSASRSGTGGSYVRYSQELTRIQKLPLDSYLRLKSKLQFSSRTLTSSEQFQLGGESSVRGYPEGNYMADYGGTGSVELNFPMYLIPRNWVLPKETVPLRYELQPYVFMDAGAGRLKKVLPGELKSQTLWSLGTGVRIHLRNSIYMNFDWAKALGDEQLSGKKGSDVFHYSFQAEY